jgi:hypothetical protein
MQHLDFSQIMPFQTLKFIILQFVQFLIKAIENEYIMYIKELRH